ncbi:hypothetical protein ACPCXF_21475 [Lysinibacillus agricola]
MGVQTPVPVATLSVQKTSAEIGGTQSKNATSCGNLSVQKRSDSNKVLSVRKRSDSNKVLSVRKRSDSNNTRLSDQHHVGPKPPADVAGFERNEFCGHNSKSGRNYAKAKWMGIRLFMSESI